jgi:predicted  nucleic acid-binding Zn-ribbon protein
MTGESVDPRQRQAVGALRYACTRSYERETLTGRLRVAKEESSSIMQDLTTSDARVAELEAELERVQTDAEQAAAHAAELSAERSRAEANRSNTSRGGQLAALTWASSTIGVRHGN